MYGLPQSGLLANEFLEKKTQQTRLPTEQVGARAMEAWLAASAIYISSWWFWTQIRRRRARKASQSGVRGTIHSNNRVERQTVCWHHPFLGLQSTPSTPFDAKLREKVLAQFNKWNDITHRTPVRRFSTEPKINTQRKLLTRHLWAQAVSGLYSKCMGGFYFWDGQSKAHCSAQ